MNKKAKTTLSTLSKIFSSRQGFTFTSKSRHSSIELHSVLPTTIRGNLGRTKLGELIKLADFTFETFVEKYGNTKNLLPVEVVFHIEHFVFFRPTLKTKDNLFPEEGKSGYIRVSIGKFNNCLHFKTKDMVFETTSEMSGNLLQKWRRKYKLAVDTKPLLVIKSRNKKLTQNELIVAGENLILLLSFLEERFIKHISKTICYESGKGKKHALEFRHTNNSEP